MRARVTTALGDLDLDVPDGWRVTVSGPELFGDVNVRAAHDPPADAPVLQLRVVTVFGDIDIEESPCSTPSRRPPAQRCLTQRC
jgi:hypothetical protein